MLVSWSTGLRESHGAMTAQLTWRFSSLPLINRSGLDLGSDHQGYSRPSLNRTNVWFSYRVIANFQ